MGTSSIEPITPVEDDRTGTSIETLRRALADNLFYTQGKFPEIATQHDYFMALAYTVRDRLVRRWITSRENMLKKDVRVVAYLSAEFLMGPQLVNNLVNMNMYDQVKQAVNESGLDFDLLAEEEEEPGLGNGGLGRLAACYLDSLATLNIPAVGYGIRYEFGIFDQEIRDGWQREITDKWLRLGNPWEIPRLQGGLQVKLGGYTQPYHDEKGGFRVNWVPERYINGGRYDVPVPGYKTTTANTLRLWKAEAPEVFDFQAFNAGDYLGAVGDKVISENVSKVLYPNDNVSQGKRLRLEQQYFFVSCSLQDMIRIHLFEGDTIDTFHKKFAIQLNDTHPSVAVAEMMRLLVDIHGIEWDTAWSMTTETFAYTNHTLLPEALERWPLSLFRDLLPRHTEIIFEINRRFLEDIRKKYPDDEELANRLSLIDESGEKFIKMAHLAAVGSHSINGVARLHTELMKQDVLRDFYYITPEKFNNKTNGVTPRRFMCVSNPELTSLINRTIGDDWPRDLDQLSKLEGSLQTPAFREEWRQIKRRRKEILADLIKDRCGVVVDPASLFDVQAKRIHEYKRHHLNILHVITLFNRIKANPGIDITPRTCIFAGKAAPGYFMAKLIIKLINSVGEVVNNDPDVADRLKVVFLPDFSVKLAQKIYPGADLSEQISTAGKEASGTGNMKFALNGALTIGTLDGALTIGTLDGANIEIREDVGADNFFLFGLTAQEVQDLKRSGYHPYDVYRSNPHLRQVMDQIASGTFSRGDQDMFRPLVETLLYRDDFMLLADYQSYIDSQDMVSAAYRDIEKWTSASILTCTRMGGFSPDRQVAEYCRDIWKVDPVEIELQEYDLVSAMLSVSPESHAKHHS